MRIVARCVHDVGCDCTLSRCVRDVVCDCILRGVGKMGSGCIQAKYMRIVGFMYFIEALDGL